MSLVLVKRTKKEEIYICPFCTSRRGSSDLVGHLHFNPNLGIYHCFRCDASLKTTGYIPIIPDYPKGIFKTEEEKAIPKTPPGFVPLSESSESFFPYYAEYAISRGVSKKDAEKYKIGFTVDSYNPFYGRLIFHFFSDEGKLEFIQGRAVSDDIEPKYWSNGQKTLAKSFKGFVEEGMIVEGIFDLIKASKIIPTGAIFGHKVRDIHMKELIKSSFKSKIILALDPDVPGSLISFIKEFPTRIVIPVFLRKNKDIGDMTTGEIQENLLRVNCGLRIDDPKLPQREKVL